MSATTANMSQYINWSVIAILFRSCWVPFRSPPFSACRRSFCPQNWPNLSFYSDLVGSHFELRAVHPYWFWPDFDPIWTSYWTNTGNLRHKWRHDERHSVSNHQPHDCLLNCLFKAQIKGTSKLRVTGLCEGIPHKGPVTRKMFPFDDVITRASIFNPCTENMPKWKAGWNYLSIPKLFEFGIGNSIPHFTMYNYSSMRGSHLIHVSKRGPIKAFGNCIWVNFHPLTITAMSFIEYCLSLQIWIIFSRLPWTQYHIMMIIDAS